jgi:hypothetical protein
LTFNKKVFLIALSKVQNESKNLTLAFDKIIVELPNKNVIFRRETATLMKQTTDNMSARSQKAESFISQLDNCELTPLITHKAEVHTTLGIDNPTYMSLSKPRKLTPVAPPLPPIRKTPIQKLSSVDLENDVDLSRMPPAMPPFDEIIGGTKRKSHTSKKPK